MVAVPTENVLLEDDPSSMGPVAGIQIGLRSLFSFCSLMVPVTERLEDRTAIIRSPSRNQRNLILLCGIVQSCPFQSRTIADVAISLRVLRWFIGGCYTPISRGQGRNLCQGILLEYGTAGIISDQTWAMPAPRYLQFRFGPYATPKVRYGSRVQCRWRGAVVIVGLSNGRLPWPIGRHGTNDSLVITCDLERAIQLESSQAVCHWFGVTAQTVRKWRRALGIGRMTPGQRARSRELFNQPWGVKAREKAWSKARDPVRRAKIAAARTGKPRPPHVIGALRRFHLGHPLPDAVKRKMSEAHRRRGTRPPKAGKAWTSAENELLGRLPPADVASQTGRTLSAVYCRRRVLRLATPATGR